MLMTPGIDWTAERKHFRAITENTRLIAWASDIDGQCFYLSPEWFAITGVAKNDGIGFGWMDRIHPRDVAAVRQTFLKAVQHRTAFEMAYRLERVDGSYTPVWSVGLPKFGDSGKFEGFFGTVCLISKFQKVGAGKRMTAESAKPILTNREREILTLISHGNTTEDVASVLGITGRTVDTHVANAGSKLGTSNRVHAIATAMRLQEI